MYLRVQYFCQKQSKLEKNFSTFSSHLCISTGLGNKILVHQYPMDYMSITSFFGWHLLHSKSINSQLTHNIQVNNSEIFYFLYWKSPREILISFLCRALLNHRSEKNTFLFVFDILFAFCQHYLCCAMVVCGVFGTQMDSITFANKQYLASIQAKKNRSQFII